MISSDGFTPRRDVMDKIIEYRIPLAVTAGALLVAFVFGVMPAQENANRQETRAAQATTDTISELEARIAALEAAQTPEGGEGADAPVTRAEVDMIVKGLVNQTGRVSRLRDQVNGMLGGEVPVAANPRISEEIRLAKRALVNLTRRINATNAIVETTQALPADVDQLMLRMSNVESAVTQLHRRIRAAQADSDAPDDQNLEEVAAQLEEILLLTEASY